MKPMLKLWLTTFALVGSLAADGAEAKDQVDKHELDRLQGTWILVSGHVEGVKVDSKAVEASRMTYAGDVITLTTPHQSKRPIKSQLKRLDPEKAPREMDWVRSAGPGPGRTMQAIYEFDGQDTYKICFDPTGNGRPKVFSTTTGACRILHVWKRVKP